MNTGMRRRGAAQRGIAVIVIAMLAASGVSGCAQLQKKFIRKKKPSETRPPVYRPVKEYEKKPTPELYQKHYVYWQTWQSELIRVIGQNRKKDIRCVNEIVGNLRDMQNVLVPEKAEALEPHIAALERVRDEIVWGTGAASYTADYAKRVLEREQRMIHRDFRYKKVKQYLKKEF